MIIMKPRLSFKIADWISNAFWNLIFLIIDLIFKILSIAFYPFTLILNWWDEYKIYKNEIYKYQSEKLCIEFGKECIEFCKQINEENDNN